MPAAPSLFYMTLSDVIRETFELGARSQRIQSDGKAWVNRGQRAIAQRRNWCFMHSQQTLTMLASATSVNFPANFKELAPEKSPITFTDPTLSQFPRPVQIRSRAELEAMAPGYQAYVTNSPAGYGTPYYVFLEQNDNGLWTLNIPAAYPVLTNISYVCSCYLFPADLALGTDHSAVTDDAELCEALINWIKWKSFSAENALNPEAEACRALYEQATLRAISQDARKRVAGRPLHW